MNKILFFSFIFLSSTMNFGYASKDNGTELSLPYQNQNYPATDSESGQIFHSLRKKRLRPKYRRRVKKTKRQSVTIEGTGFDIALQSPNLNQTAVEFEFPDNRRNFTVEITDISHRSISNEDNKPPQYSFLPKRRTKISRPIVAYDSQQVSSHNKQTEQQQPPLYNQLKPRLLKHSSFIFEIPSTQANTPSPNDYFKSNTLRRPKLRSKTNNDVATEASNADKSKSYISVDDPIFQRIQKSVRIKSTTVRPQNNLEATTRKSYYATRSPALVFYDDESDVNNDELKLYLSGFQNQFGSKKSMTVPPPLYDDYTDSNPKDSPRTRNADADEETQITQSSTSTSVIAAPSLGTERTVSLSLSGFLPNYPVSTQSPRNNDDEPYRNRQIIVSTVEKRKRTVLGDDDQPAEREVVIQTQTQDNQKDKDNNNNNNHHHNHNDDDEAEDGHEDEDGNEAEDHGNEAENGNERSHDDSITKGNTPSRAQNYYTHAQVVHHVQTPESLKKDKAREEEKQQAQQDEEEENDRPKPINIAPNIRYAPSRSMPPVQKTTTTEKNNNYNKNNNYQEHLRYSPKEDTSSRYYDPPSRTYSPSGKRPATNYDDPAVRMDILYKNGHPGVLPPPRGLHEEQQGPKPYLRPQRNRSPYDHVVSDAVERDSFPHDPLNDEPPLKFDPQSDRFYGEPTPDRNPAQSARDDPVQSDVPIKATPQDDPIKEVEPPFENQQNSPPIQRREGERLPDDRDERDRDRHRDDDKHRHRDDDRHRDSRDDDRHRDRDDDRYRQRDRDDDRERRYRVPSYYDVPAVTAYPLTRDERSRDPETDPNGYIQDFVSLDNNFQTLPRVTERDFGSLLPKIPSDDIFTPYHEQERNRDVQPARSNSRPRSDRGRDDYEDEHRPASSGYFDGDRNSADAEGEAAYLEERDRDNREAIRELRDSPSRDRGHRNDDERLPEGFSDGYQSAGRGFGFGGGGDPPRQNLPLDPIYTRTLKQFDDEILSLQQNEGTSKDFPPQPPAAVSGYRNDRPLPLPPPSSPEPSQIEPYRPEPGPASRIHEEPYRPEPGPASRIHDEPYRPEPGPASRIHDEPYRPEPGTGIRNRLDEPYRPEPGTGIRNRLDEPYRPEPGPASRSRHEEPYRREPSGPTSRSRHEEPEIRERHPEEYRSTETAAPERVTEEEEVTHRDIDPPAEDQKKESDEEEEEEEEEEPEEPEGDGRHVPRKHVHRHSESQEDKDKREEESRRNTSVKTSNDKRPPPEKPQTEKSGSIDDDITGIEQEWGRVG